MRFTQKASESPAIPRLLPYLDGSVVQGRCNFVFYFKEGWNIPSEFLLFDSSHIHFLHEFFQGTC